MRNLFFILFACSVTSGIVQPKEEISYIGGFKLMERDVFKNFSHSLRSRSYMLMFEVTFKNKQAVTVSEIYSVPDSISNGMKTAIEKTLHNWKSTSKQTQKVIIPVHLILDEGGYYNYYVPGTNNYGSNPTIKKAFILPPIVILFSLPVR